jgi:hypothetical protein
MIDVFHLMDQSGDGSLTTREFRTGLAQLGFNPNDDEFNAVVDELDKDHNGDVSIKEFDKALKLAERKAKAEGRGSELEAWTRSSFEQFNHSHYDWSRRSIRMVDGPCMEATETAAATATTQRLVRLGTNWSTASRGPTERALANSVGKGSLEDSSITRQRIFDGAVSPRNFAPRILAPTLKPLVVPPSCKKEGRFGYEPTSLPSDELLHGREKCAEALRNNVRPDFTPGGGPRKFPNAPTMQSSVDQVVFNRDMDFSGEAMFDDDFAVMFAGSAGLPSWH